MSYTSKPELTKITLPSDNNYWVAVTTDFTYGDIKGLGTDLQGSDASDRMLSLAIKEWNLDGDDGAVLEITPENINLLKKDDVLAIIQEVNKGAGDDTEKKAS
jgi:hypothetical protein